MNCEYCDKPLRKWNKRDDWKRRTTHLKCWKEKRDRERVAKFISVLGDIYAKKEL